ncbi:unnamed protein product [Cryptosporidium hominis]|uniref:Phospholipase/carboxylesterase/thioesterase n=1 Tax=Cryptosporidium hominis TaxID=237895 RepID=A0A0S4TAX3_CRYHO|nr:hypothetical protein [Cryptosporidium hominis TU502]OLQ16335.1 Phospholipase/Carboxylesterase [Cryptosporidium hominis]PPA62563.1 Phospholipase/Carboxylesterase family protein [Cryptosporidium hominis]PPS97112.1 Phospholipase/carboxylesterase/thioesterase [Cryptosporidium hominis]CUV04330.1 unnamed protein product [Cryptosporidium hominis]|eukprot:PPS97112.1 Phospholipase/carboxylesterase/thioesterase [Cryptosporidium hominis]
MIQEGDGNNGQGFYYEPKDYDSVLIWLHGKGDNANSYLDFIHTAQNYPELKKTKIILPTADIITFKRFGFSDNAWFDMEDLRPYALEDLDDINNSVSRITRLISLEIEKGIDPKKISLGGFSQGSAIVFLISMASRKYTLGSCIVVGGWLPLTERGFKEGKESKIATEELTFDVRESVKEHVDFIVLHGEADPVVLYQWSLMNKDFVLEFIKPKKFIYKSYPGVVHTITSQMMVDIFNFLSKRN